MRYIILVLLSMPIILLAFINLVTKYKTKRIGKKRFNTQVVLWLCMLSAIIFSFPLYNLLVGNRPLESSSLSLFDIVEVTVIVYLIYVIGNLRQRLGWTEKRLRDLHQELSIKMSSYDAKN